MQERFIDEFVRFWLLSSAYASEWNPNEGMFADQVLQADGQGEWVTARRLAQELLKDQPQLLRWSSCIGEGILAWGRRLCTSFFSPAKSIGYLCIEL